MVDGVVIDDKLERVDPKPIKGRPMTKHLRVLRRVLYCFHRAVSVSCTCCVCVSCCIALYRVVCVLRMGGRLNSLTVMLARAEKWELGGPVQETKFSDGKCWLRQRNRSWAEYRLYIGSAVQRLDSLMVNACSGGNYEVVSVGRNRSFC